MVDGPASNFNLGKHWNPFVQAVRGECSSSAELAQSATIAIAKEISTPILRELVSALKREFSQPQQGLFPLEAVEKIFDSYPREPFGENLEIALKYRIESGMNPEDALEAAGLAAESNHLESTIRRVDEQTMLAAERGSLHPGEVRPIRNRTHEAFEIIPRGHLWSGLWDAKKPVRTIEKLTDLDDGPAFR